MNQLLAWIQPPAATCGMSSLLLLRRAGVSFSPHTGELGGQIFINSTTLLASFPGSPPLCNIRTTRHQKAGEPGRFYHVSDVKGKEKLIVRGHSNHNAYTSLVFAWLFSASFIHEYSRAKDPLASFKAGSCLAAICTDLKSLSHRQIWSTALS